MRTLCWICVLFVWTIWAGCSNVDMVQRFCNINCKKLKECQSLGGQSVDQCIASCKTSGEQNMGDNCQVASSTMDVCLAAVEAASCPFSLPPACQNLCSGQSDERSQGQDGGGTVSDTATGSDRNSPDQVASGNCGTPQGSCIEKSERGTVCREYANQIPIALTGIKNSCESESNATWSSGPCQPASLGLNFGCEITTPAGCIKNYTQVAPKDKATAEQGCTMGGGRPLSP